MPKQERVQLAIYKDAEVYLEPHPEASDATVLAFYDHETGEGRPLVVLFKSDLIALATACLKATEWAGI